MAHDARLTAHGSGFASRSFSEGWAQGERKSKDKRQKSQDKSTWLYDYNAPCILQLKLTGTNELITNKYPNVKRKINHFQLEILPRQGAPEDSGQQGL
jgi:hypothetical protein